MRIFALLVVASLGGCDVLTSYTYRAEVGYYEGDKEVWFVGTDKTREQCVAEAISRFNAFNAESPRRAFSWACRKMQGDQFLDRVR